MSALLDRYRQLARAERLVALAFGVVHPHELTSAQMAKVLRRAAFTHSRRIISVQSYRDASKALVKAGVVRNTRRQGRLTGSPEWVPWLTARAVETRRLAKVERSFRALFPPHWSNYNADLAMGLRCRAVAGEFDRILRMPGEIDPEEWGWLARPGVEHVLASVPEMHADSAFAGCLDQVILTAERPDALLKAYPARRAKREVRAAGVALVHVLRGEFDGALATFADLPAELRESKPARTGLASTRALVATLRGDDEEAAKRIDEAIACEKAGTRKRNVYPNCGAFTLSLFSLVRSSTPARAAKLKHLLGVAPKVESDPFLVSIVDFADYIRGGGEVEWHKPAGNGSLGSLFGGWAVCWTDYSRDIGDPLFANLLSFGAKAVDNGYRWLGNECLDVCARWWKANGRPESDLLELLGVTAEDGVPPPSELVAANHEKMGTRSLSTVVAPRPEWEHALEGIERVAHETRKKTPRRGKVASSAPRRLAWVLSTDAYGDVEASPKEQRGYKNGRWSKGRAVSLRRLRAEAGAMDFLIDQDRAAAGRIVRKRERWGGQSAHHLPLSGLFELAGHPYAFNEDGGPVEVVRRDPELILEERDGRLLVRVVPHSDLAGRERHIALMPSEERVEVTRFTPGHRNICEAIPPEGSWLPLEARERLVGAVSALAREIRVQGAIADGARVATRVEADPAPWVRLEPRGPGLAAAVLVEPVPGSATYFQPGEGGTTAFAAVDGEAVQARRDHGAEILAVAELTLSCPALSALGPESSLVLSDPADCLELVDQLEAANARCLWPKGRPFKVLGRADASSLRLSVKSAADWFSAAGTLEIDETRALDLRRLFELMDASPASRFVQVEDGAFVALTASFRRQLADLRSVSSPSGGKRLRLHGLAALALQDLFDGARLEADEGWRDQRHSFREARSFEPRLPGTLQAELRPYQEDGFRWLARLGRWGAGACLADDMGLGKTVQTLALLLDRATNGPALVVAPTSVVANWMGEARRFAPTLNAVAYTGPAASRAPLLRDLGPFDVVVTTYGLLHIDSEALAGVEWDTVVLDEAQAIKNPATKRARAARKLRAAFRIVTTGTPIQNSVVDLYSLFGFLNPGMLGSRKRFRDNFAAPIAEGRDPAARTRLRRLIAPFVLRRLKADVLDDLPPRTEVILHVEMSPEEAALYEALRRRAMEDLEALARQRSPAAGALEDGQRRLQVLAHLTRLRLACCNPRLVQPDGPPSSKLETFATTLDELRQGRHKVLVFSQFVRHLKLIEELLRESGIPYKYLDGSTPAKKRAERIAAFQAGEGDAFLISLRAGGTGLNLTAADYVIHMDPWWNPAAEDQASDRAHRIGQTRPVTIYRLVAKGTIEERIVELHRSKRELADKLLEGADAPARLTTEELLGLLQD